MNTKVCATEIYLEATRRGLRLIARGDKLEVTPKSRLSSEFAAVLREHKAQLIALLEIPDRDLEHYYADGLHMAEQILAGEFDGADSSTTENLFVRLRDFADPQCQLAVARLKQKNANLFQK